MKRYSFTFARLFMVLFVVLFTLPTTNSWAATHEVDYKQSSVQFTGKHAGNTFEGAFTAWNADITFNADDLQNSSLSATFETASAETGDALYDGTLPQADWFAAEQHPEAKFISKQLTANADGTYQAAGILTIRDISKPINFNFSLEEMADGMLNAKGTLKLDRLLFDIGKSSDPDADWVSQYINITLNIMASRLYSE